MTQWQWSDKELGTKENYDFGLLSHQCLGVRGDYGRRAAGRQQDDEGVEERRACWQQGDFGQRHPNRTNVRWRLESAA
jgi:hypothetical protein